MQEPCWSQCHIGFFTIVIIDVSPDDANVTDRGVFNFVISWKCII